MSGLGFVTCVLQQYCDPLSVLEEDKVTTLIAAMLKVGHVEIQPLFFFFKLLGQGPSRYILMAVPLCFSVIVIAAISVQVHSQSLPGGPILLGAPRQLPSLRVWL